MKATVALIALAVVVGLARADAVSAVSTAAAPQAPAKLLNGEPTIDALVDKFCEALAQKDKTGLRALRLTQDEYLGIVLPGSVEPGQPWATYSDQAQQYFWGLLNGKSSYSEANLLQEFGGHQLRVKNVQYRKGTQVYAGYRAYKQLTVTVDDAGSETELRIGSIAEIDGQYKFISFVRD